MARSFDEFKRIYDAELERFNASADLDTVEEEYKGYVAVCNLLGVDSEIFGEADDAGNVDILMRPIYQKPQF